MAAAGALPGRFLPQRHHAGAGPGHRGGLHLGSAHAPHLRAQDPVGLGGGDDGEGPRERPQGRGHLLRRHLLPGNGKTGGIYSFSLLLLVVLVLVVVSLLSWLFLRSLRVNLMPTLANISRLWKHIRFVLFWVAVVGEDCRLARTCTSLSVEVSCLSCKAEPPRALSFALKFRLVPQLGVEISLESYRSKRGKPTAGH